MLPSGSKKRQGVTAGGAVDVAAAAPLWAVLERTGKLLVLRGAMI